MNANHYQAQLLSDYGYVDPVVLKSFLEECQSQRDVELCALLIERGQLHPQQAQLVRQRLQAERRQAAAQIEFQPTLINAAQASKSGREASKAGGRVSESFVPTNRDLQTLEKLGQGGMATVYRVLDKSLGRDVAMKVLVDGDEEAEARFLREAKITSRLQHPGIPPVFEVSMNADGQPYFLMKVVEGRTLGEYIEDYHGRGCPPEALRPLLEVLVKVAEAVAYAHNQDIIHRDLKPENVMIGQFGEVMVMDWGIAKKVGEADDPMSFSDGLTPEFLKTQGGLTVSGAVLGTPGYMAPEQAGGEEVGTSADVFALGALLTVILTNQPPVMGATIYEVIAATLKGHIYSPRSRKKTVPRELEALAKMALSYEVQDRWANADFFLSDLKAYLGGREMTCYRRGLVEAMLGNLRRNAAVITLVLVLLSALLGASALALKLRAGSAEAARLKADTARVTAEQTAMKSEQARMRAEQDKLRFEAAVALERQKRAEMKATTMAESQALLLKAENLARLGAKKAEVNRLIQKALNIGQPRYGHYINASRIYLQMEELGGAKHCLVKAIELTDKPFQALFLSAQIESRDSNLVGKMTDSLKALVRWGERGANNDYVTFACAYRDYLEGRLRDALSGFRNLQSLEVVNYSLRFQAAAHFDLGDKRLALLFASKAVSIDPNNGGLQKLLARIYFQRKEYNRALFHVNQAIQSSPSKLDLRLVRGDIFQRLGQHQSAYKEYKTAFAFKQVFKPARRYYEVCIKAAESLASAGRVEESLATIDKVLAMSPSYPLALQRKGRALYSLKKYKAAIEVFNQLIGVGDPSFLARSYAIRGDCYRRLDENQRAYDDFTKSIGLGDKNSISYNNRGLVLVKLGRFKEAVRDYSDAIKLKGRAESYSGRALAYEKLEEYKKGLVDIEKAIELRSERPHFRMQQARLLVFSGQVEAAKAVCDLVFESWDDFTRAEVFEARGLVYYKLGLYERSRVNFVAALAFGHELYHSRLHCTLIDIKAQRFKVAREGLKIFEEGAGTAAAVLYLKAELALAEGQSDDARALFERMIQSDPKHQWAGRARAALKELAAGDGSKNQSKESTGETTGESTGKPEKSE